MLPKNKLAASVLILVICLVMIPDACVIAAETSQKSDSQEAEQTAEQTLTVEQDPSIDQSRAEGEEAAETAAESHTQSPVFNALSNTTKTNTSAGNQSGAAKKLPVIKRFRFSGWDTTFKNKVNRNRFLPANTVPTSFKLTAKRKSMKLKWRRPKATGAIDGYIVLRKSGFGNRYYELKRLPKSKTSYEDKKAKKKNWKYAYMVVGYKKGKIIRVSPYATPWVVGYTTRSKKKNLYKTKITNASGISKIVVGSSVQAKAKVPKKTAHKVLRWYSSNRNVATVTNGGLIKAVAAGSAKISVRTATGRVTSTTVTVVKPAPRPTMLAVMQSWVGFSEANKKHRSIIDIYNTYRPRPRGYKMKYSDAWCDACVSAAAIASGNVGAVGAECGVPSHISIFKKKGIWIEDGTITPRAGDIIVFAWSKSRQPNNASGSHIGIVESVKKGKITTIEGNYRDMVGRRTIKVGWGYIRGYARPNYVR